MQGKRDVQGVDLLDQYIQKCHAFLDDWIRFNQLVTAYPGPGVNRQQLETLFLQVKSKLARDQHILRDRLGADCKFSPDIVNIVSGATNLESIYSQSEVAIRKLQNEWHRAFITINETFGNLEDKRKRALAGERVSVGGVTIQIKVPKPFPVRQVLLGTALVVVILALPAGLYVMRNFLGYWAPKAGEGIVYSEAMTDEDKIRVLLATMKSAIEQQDIDVMMTAYSDRYSDEGGRGKTDVRAFLQAYKLAGGFQGARLDVDQAELVIDGDRARIAPLFFVGPSDQVSFTAIGEREGNRWLITALGGI